MHTFSAFIMTVYLLIAPTQADDIARQVDDGVELLKTGSIDIILPDKLSFTMKNVEQCVGYFRICYAPGSIVDPKNLIYYKNYAHGCPQNSCSLMLHPPRNAEGLVALIRDGSYYGEFDSKNDTWCPLNIVKGRAYFTTVTLPNCPVIINGARLTHKRNTEKPNISSMKWIVATCGFAFLILILAIVVGTIIFLRYKKEPETQVNPVTRIVVAQQNSNSAISQTSNVSNVSVHYTKSKIRRKLKELNIEPGKASGSYEDDGKC